MDQHTLPSLLRHRASLPLHFVSVIPATLYRVHHNYVTNVGVTSARVRHSNITNVGVVYTINYNHTHFELLTSHTHYFDATIGMLFLVRNLSTSSSSCFFSSSSSSCSSLQICPPPRQHECRSRIQYLHTCTHQSM